MELPQGLLGAGGFRLHRNGVAISQRKVYVSYGGEPVFDPH